MNQDRHVILVEPWFANFGHMQYNRSFLTVMREAFHGGRITFACTPEYRTELEETQLGRQPIAEWLEARAWQHPNKPVWEFWHRTRWLIDLARRARDRGIAPTHLVILGSSGPLLLALFAAKLLSLPGNCKTFAVLHGGNEILRGWQPRNPFLRLLSFRTAITLLPVMGIKVIAAEMFIAEELRSRFQKQARAIRCIPMAFDATEFLTPPVPDAGPLRVLFLGQATPHKGFAEFVRLAEQARALGDGSMEFRAAGAVRQDTRSIDQSALARRAGDSPLARRELIAELSKADLVYTWHSEYYDISSSGILLDCVGLGVPMVGRRSRAIAAIEAKYGACGLFAEDIESLFPALAQLGDVDNRRRQIAAWQLNLRQARIDRSAQVLGPVARQELES